MYAVTCYYARRDMSAINRANKYMTRREVATSSIIIQYAYNMEESVTLLLHHTDMCAIRDAEH